MPRPKMCPARIGTISDNRGRELKYCLYVKGFDGECLKDKHPELKCNLS